MGSWRLVTFVTSVGIALWATALWVSQTREKPSVDVAHRLVDLNEADVASISMDQDGDALTVSFTRAEQKTVATSNGRPLAAAAVAGFFAALENTYTRRVRTDASNADRIRLGTEPGRASLTIVSTSKASRTLRLGVAVANGELTWVSSRSQAGSGLRTILALISTTEAKRLFLPPAKWVEARVFAGLDAIESIEIRSGESSAKFAGTPLAWRTGFSSIRLDPFKLQLAMDELRELVVVAGSPDDGPEPNTDRETTLELKVRSEQATVTVRIAGVGCRASARRAQIIDSAAADASTRIVCVDGAAIDRWRGIAEQPQRLAMVGVLRTDVGVSRFGLTRIANRSAEKLIEVETKGDSDAAASEFLSDIASAGLGQPAKRKELESSGPLAVRARLDLEFENGDTDRVMVAERGGRYFLSLAGQPRVWPLDKEPAKRILAARQETFRFRGLIRRDPSELRQLSVGRRQWSFEIGRGWNPALSDEVASSIANLSALRFEPELKRAQAGLSRPRRQISVVFAKAPIAADAPNRLRISVGRKTSDGCFVEVETTSSPAEAIAPIAVVDQAICDRWLAL